MNDGWQALARLISELKQDEVCCTRKSTRLMQLHTHTHALRADALRRRERYEAKHSGGFERIYPVDDRTQQGLYEELLRGASELFQSTFQARALVSLFI
jgi:hypothetical protein